MAETVKIVIDADDKASKEIQGVRGALDKLGSVAKGLALGGVAVGVAGVAALGNVLMDSVQAAMEAQAAQAQLAAVIESTGGVAGVTADMANRLASELQNVTRFEDDAVLGAENILLTFTNIGREVFPDAMWAAADLSQALGQDLTTSAMQLGKALNDPIAGVSALQRVGVSFTDAQKEMIKKLSEAGDRMGAQKIILKELETQVGGSARAYGETFAGKLDIFNNKLGDVKEKIGLALIGPLTELVDQVGPMVLEWANAFAVWIETDGKKAIEDFAGWVKDDFVPALEDVGEFFREDFPDAVDTANEAADKFMEGQGGGFLTLWQEIAKAIQSAIDWYNRWSATTGSAGGGGSGAGGPNAPVYADPNKGWNHGQSEPMRGYNLPMGGGWAPVTINVNIAGNADPRTTRGAVLDALGLARARGMV